MKEEIITLVNTASNAIVELENYLFNNLKEKYIFSKSVLDDHKEHIEKIRGILQYDLTQEEIEMAKHDLNLIIEIVENGKNGISFTTKNVEETESQDNELLIQNDNIEFSEEDIDALLKALDENEFETVFPEEEIKVENIENSINTLEESINIEENQNIAQASEEIVVPNVFETDYSNDLDISAIDAFLNSDSTESANDSQDAFRL